MALTDTALRTVKPGAKTVKLFDGGGMYLEVSPKGGRWWRLKYRFGRKEKRISLGIYPEVSLKEARSRRDDARKLVAEGTDPSQDRKAAKAVQADRAANTFEAIAREWYEKRTAGWAPSHSTRLLRLFERDVFPSLGSWPIATIEPPDLLAVLRRIEDRKAIDTAHRALGHCGQVFRYAIATARLKSDPSRDLRGALAPAEGTHFAAVTEPEDLGDLLRVLDGYDGTPAVAAALKLAPLLFVRPGELRTAEWADIDMEKAEWCFTTSKTKTPHVVPLPRQALDVLKALHPITSRSRFVFPSFRSNTRPMSEAAVLAALRRMGIDKTVASGHGFRATARTLLDEVLGFRVDWIETQLAHAVRDPNGRAYNRTSFLPERRKMMQDWADYLDKLRAAVKVIPFKQAETA